MRNIHEDREYYQEIMEKINRIESKLSKLEADIAIYKKEIAEGKRFKDKEHGENKTSGFVAKVEG